MDNVIPSVRKEGTALDVCAVVGMSSSNPGSVDREYDPIKIAIVVERFPIATETFLMNEVRALQDSGAQVVVLACSTGDRCQTATTGESGIAVLNACERPFSGIMAAIVRSAWRSPGRSVAVVGLTVAAAGLSLRRGYRALRAMALAYRMSGYVRSEGFSVIYAQFINRPALVAAILSELTGIPCSVSAHARDVFVPDFRLTPLVRVARLILVCSTAAHHHLSTQVAPALYFKIRRLHHGLDLERFVPQSCRSREMRYSGESGIGSFPPRLQVLTVARLVPKKGVDTVLRALGILKRRGWEVHLRLVGDGPERKFLLRMAEWLGLKLEHSTRATREAIYEWMCSADVLAMGCTTARDGDRDGVPNAVLEAMATGLPVVTTAGGSVADAVEHANTGLLVPPGDAEALALAIEEVATNEGLRRRIVSNARMHVEAHFNMRKNAKELLALLTEASR